MTNMPPSSEIIEQLPHRRNEAWKWTDLRGVVKGQENGLTSAGSLKFTAPDGVFVSQGEGHKGENAMSKLAANFAGEAWNIYVPKGFKSDAALMIDNITRGHSRVAIMVDQGAELNMVEHHRGVAKAFVNMDLQIHLAEGASLSRIIVHDDPDDCVRVATTCVAAEKGTNFTQHSLSFGGALARLETRLYGEDEDITANIHGAYLLNGQRHTDMTSHIDLQHPGAVIRQTVKGVVTDKSRGVFQGKFYVQRDAQHIDAEMRHDALMLSDTAEVRAKPELEIYADDVKCSHGATAGELDERELFYLRSRGFDPETARTMLTFAFADEVLERFASKTLLGQAKREILRWLPGAEILGDMEEIE